MLPELPGLCSTSYKEHSTVEEVVQLCVQHGLREIEWHGEAHVPHGDLHEAERVRVLCQQAGIRIVCYGSYFSPSISASSGLTFEAVLDTARALGAPIIRCWLTDKTKHSNCLPSRSLYDAMVADAVRISEMAYRHQISVSYEGNYGFISKILGLPPWEAADCFFRDIENHPGTVSHWQQDMNGDSECTLLRYLLDHNKLGVVHLNFFSPTYETSPAVRAEQKIRSWPQCRALLENHVGTFPVLLEACHDGNPLRLPEYLEIVRRHFLPQTHEEVQER